MFGKNVRIFRGKAISCPAVNNCCKGCNPVSILRPEIVIEERRWYPYPLIIRHYIEKPEPDKVNVFKRWYRKRQAECKLKKEKKKERLKQLEERERLERERCLRELRRLHSYHQSLCNRTQSLPVFSKDTKQICKTKPISKMKWKTRSVSVKTDNRDRWKSSGYGFSCFRIFCDIFCSLGCLAIVGFTLICLL